MKYIKYFESDTDKYVIVTDGKRGLAVAIDCESDLQPFRYIPAINNSPIKTYTLEEAEKLIPVFTLRYDYLFIFRIITLEEFNLLINANKFNL